MTEKLTLRDVIIVALLGLVGFILSTIGGMITGLFGSYGMFIHSAIGSFLCGPVFMVMVKRLRKRGIVFIYYAISAIIYLIMGMTPMVPIYLLAGLVGEIIIGNYFNNTRINVAYVVAELIYAMHGLILLLVFGAEGLAEQFPTMFTVESAMATQEFYFQPSNLIIIVAIQLLGSILGAVFGNYIYRRFFDKKTESEEILS